MLLVINYLILFSWAASNFFHLVFNMTEVKYNLVHSVHIRKSDILDIKTNRKTSFDFLVKRNWADRIIRMISFHSWITAKIETLRSVKLKKSNFFWYVTNYMNVLYTLGGFISGNKQIISYWPRLSVAMKLFNKNIHYEGIWRKRITNEWKYRCSLTRRMRVEPHEIYWSISLAPFLYKTI